MMTASNITTKLKCPHFAADVVCVGGHRYRIVNEGATHPHPLDLDGLLYLGECLRCPKATGGLAPTDTTE